MRCFFFFLVLFFGGWVEAGAAVENTIDIQRSLRECGRKSLFLWLKLSGHKVTYQDVADVVPVSAEGTSLAELVQGSTHFLHPAKLKVIHTNFSGLASQKMPVIAHVWLDGQQRRAEGHYVVLLKINTDSVVQSDPLTGSVYEVAMDDFLPDYWSGYLLVPPSSLISSLEVFMLLLPVASIIILLAYFLRRRKGSLGGTRSPATTVLSAIVCLNIATGCSDSIEGTIETDSQTVPSELYQDPQLIDATGDSRANLIIKTTNRSQELGTVPLGSEAIAKFHITNISNSLVTLTKGQPSCGCMKASLTDSILSPGESVELSLLLKSGEGYSGLRTGTVSIGAEGHQFSLPFTARGVVEGMTTNPATIRVPDDYKKTFPSIITGDITLGADKQNVEVKIVNVVLKNEHLDPISLGDPKIYPSEVSGVHYRRRFEIPVVFSAKSHPKTNSYKVRVTYKIGDSTGDHFFSLNVFPQLN